MLDLKELERKLDEVLNNETPESLKKWLDDKREEERIADLESNSATSACYASEAVPGSEQEYNRVKNFIEKKDYIIADELHLRLGISGYRAVKYIELFEKEGLLLKNENEPWQADKVIHNLKLLNNDSCPEA